jgi:hypothetical protein
MAQTKGVKFFSLSFEKPFHTASEEFLLMEWISAPHGRFAVLGILIFESCSLGRASLSGTDIVVAECVEV